MKFFLILLIFVSITFDCHKQDIYKYNAYYEIIDDFLRIKYYDSDVAILCELEEVKKYPNDESDLSQDTQQLLEPPPLPPPPPPPGKVYISKLNLKLLNKMNLIDTLDIHYFYDQIEHLDNFTLNPSRINKTTIKQASIDSIFRIYSSDEGFKILKQHYNIDSYLKFSNPLISRNGKMMIFDIDFYCGILCGHGDRYVMRKQNDRWRIIYKRQTWIS